METKQVIVMRKDLNMRKGKMVAQGAHAALAPFTNRMRNKSEKYDLHTTILLSNILINWLENSFKKITVSVNSEDELFEIKKKAEELNLDVSLILDNAHTEFKEPTYTCLSIGPDISSEIDKVTGHLKLL